MLDIRDKALIVLEYMALTGSTDWMQVYRIAHAALHQDDPTDAVWLAELEEKYRVIKEK
jgi:hypothetical protein